MKHNVPQAGFWLKMTIVAVLSGVLYNSWPLGYWLNPGVSKAGLASALEGVGQGYNWLFIASDIVSSLLIALVCWLVWQRVRGTHDKRLISFALLNVAVFAAGTIIDAALPLRCDPTIQRCVSYTHDHLLLAHGLFSILAAICLFISLVILWWHHRHTVLLNGLLVGYLLFSLFSLIAVLEPGVGNLSQHYYLLLCGVWLALLPRAIHDTVVVDEAAATRKSPDL
ncbi:MAG TPA: DUF998 domain-containing protein [Candidatus Saccharimonadales bacterium]